MTNLQTFDLSTNKFLNFCFFLVKDIANKILSKEEIKIKGDNFDKYIEYMKKKCINSEIVFRNVLNEYTLTKLMRKAEIKDIPHWSNKSDYSSNRKKSLRCLQVISLALLKCTNPDCLKKELKQLTNMSGKNNLYTIRKYLPFLKEINPEIDIDRWYPHKTPPKTKLSYNDILNYIKSKNLVMKTSVEEFNINMERDGSFPSKTKFIVICPLGHSFPTQYNLIRYSSHASGCPHCAGNIPITYEVLKELVKVHGGTIITSKEEFCINKNVDKTKPSKTKVLALCKKGHKFFTYWDILKHHNAWCPHCYGNTPLSYRKIREYAESIGFEVITSEKEFNKYKTYFNTRPSDTQLTVVCPNKHVWDASYRKLSKYWCPFCSEFKFERISRWYCEQIFSFISGVNVKFPETYLRDISIRIIRQGNRNELYTKGLRYDGYSQVKIGNQIYRVAFEYNGKQHYIFPNHIHKNTVDGQKRFNIGQKNDRLKEYLSKLEINNIVLIIIPYYIDEKMNHPYEIQEHIINEFKKYTDIDLQQCNIPQFNHLSKTTYKNVLSYF